MTIECHNGNCSYHSIHTDPDNGPFCDERECRLTATLKPLPKINVRLLTKDRLGATYVDPVRVDREEDGSLTVVIEAWPER